MTSPNDGQELTAVRGSKYGPAEIQFYFAQEIKRVLRRALQSNMDFRDNLDPEMRDVVVEVLDMIATKLSRIVCGHADYDDNWRDIIGYSTLVMNMCYGLAANGKPTSKEVSPK